MTLEASLAIIGTLVGIVGGVYGVTRNKKQDDTANGQQIGTILSELGFIKSGVEDIKNEQREQRKINTEFYTRLGAVEQSAKQAHKRIDHLEGTRGRDV